MEKHRYLERVIPPEQALQRLKELVRPVTESLETPTWKAAGYVLAEDVKAWMDFPPRPRSAYDGYAVASESTPGKFRVIGEAAIGKVSPGFSIGRGEAAYVSTGAYLPEGADTVIPEEAVKREGEYIIVDKKFTRWKNVDPPGSYVRKGEIILPKGSVITIPDVVGLLNIGITKVRVRRKLRVGIIATGGELFEPSDPEETLEKISKGLVADTTTILIEWAIKEITPWAEPYGKELMPDEIESLAWKIERMLDHVDVVLVTGGTGPSEVDNFYRLCNKLEEKGAILVFRGLRMRGGRPTSAMVLRGKPIIGLSGHPISALHGFIRIVEPLLRYMAGVNRAPASRLVPVRIAEEYSTQFPRLLRARLEYGDDGIIQARILPPEKQLSSNIVSHAEADAYLIVDAKSHKPGDIARAVIYREPTRAG